MEPYVPSVASPRRTDWYRTAEDQCRRDGSKFQQAFPGYLGAPHVARHLDPRIHNQPWRRDGSGRSGAATQWRQARSGPRIEIDEHGASFEADLKTVELTRVSRFICAFAGHHLPRLSPGHLSSPGFTAFNCSPEAALPEQRSSCW